VIQRLIYDDDGGVAIELDEEGIDYLMDGLIDCRRAEPGEVFSTPSFWKEQPPWWKFWDRKEVMMTGEFRLRRVADQE
jgi:hypothetical protein